MRGLCRGIDTFLGNKGRDLTAKGREIMFSLFLSDLEVTLVENLEIEMGIEEKRSARGIRTSLTTV